MMRNSVSISQDQYEYLQWMERRRVFDYQQPPTSDTPPRPTAQCTPAPHDRACWLTGRERVIISERERVLLDQAVLKGELPEQARYWEPVWRYRLGWTGKRVEPDGQVGMPNALTIEEYVGLMQSAVTALTNRSWTPPPLPPVQRDPIEDYQAIRMRKDEPYPGEGEWFSLYNPREPDEEEVLETPTNPFEAWASSPEGRMMLEVLDG